MSHDAHSKLERLKADIRQLDSLAVAFSGGVNSTFLLYVAHQELGDKVLAFTALSAFYPDRESNEAVEFAKTYNIRQITHSVD